MTGFDTIAIVDWSSGNDRGPTPKPDAVWACIARSSETEAPVYLRNRDVAIDWLTDLLRAEVAAGRRILAGFDFPFGYPAGFAERLTGRPDPLAVWDWLTARLTDTPNGNNRFAVAAAINRAFPGIGPFWFNGTGSDITDLPRLGRDRGGHGMAEKRQAETLARGSFTCWQMGGAGSVGGQAITGMAALSRLRANLAGQVAVWPFEPLDGPVALVEVWPSLIAREVAEARREDEVKDAAQVRVLAGALWRLREAGELCSMLDDVPRIARREEGWILGLGHEAALRAAAKPQTMQTPQTPLADDCLALPPGHRWTPVDDALALLRDRLACVARPEVVATKAADGRILARDQTAARANPPGANAAVDGFGFAHGALGPGPQSLPLARGRAAAGAPFTGALPAGQALRILTGALLPPGVDTVVMQEDCTVTDAAVSFADLPRPSANTRRAGEDLRAEAIAIARGHRVRPPDLALLTAVGVPEVEVFRRLRIGVLSTGDELAAPGETGDPARTFDANRPMLLGLAARWNGVPVDLGCVPDDRAALRAALDGARADVILTSGGASAGDEDHVSALLAETGSLEAWRIALKPGRPLALGMWRGTPIFGLPGNPVAALVCALIFVRPALSVLGGGGWIEPQGFVVPAAFSRLKKAGRREYLRARLRDGAAEVFASEGSGRISGLSWADGLVEVADDVTSIRQGDPVRYLPYASFGL